MPVFNIEEKDFLDMTEKLIGTDNNWAAHVTQEIPLPRTSSPSPTNNQPGALEQLETFTKDDMDMNALKTGIQALIDPLSNPYKFQLN